MDMKPISRIILQAADGSVYYSIPWDATTALTVAAGSGTAAVTHAGTSYAFAASDPAATVKPTTPATPIPSGPLEPMTITVGPHQQYPYLTFAMGPVNDALYKGRRLALDIQVEPVDDSYYLDSFSSHVGSKGGVWPPFDEVFGDWNKPNTLAVVLRRVPGSYGLVVFPVTSGYGHLYYGKGILIATQNDFSCDGFHFRGAKRGDSDGNLSGLRLDANPSATTPGYGKHRILNCIFEDCDDGILGGSSGQTLELENVQLLNCGSGSGFTHNAYLNHYDVVTATNVLSTGAKVGHLFKCRASQTILRNVRLFDGPDGSASYALDVPNGGILDIDGLTIHKGVHASNAPLIAFAEEGDIGGGRNAPDGIKIRRLTLLSERPVATLGTPAATGLWNASGSVPDIQGTSIFGVSPDALYSLGPYGSASYQPLPDSAVTTLTAMPTLDMTSPVNPSLPA